MMTIAQFTAVPRPVERHDRAMTEKVMRLLADLGDDEAAVAAMLRGQGCRGARLTSSGCPVAVYLTRALPDCWAHVSTQSVGVWQDRSAPPRTVAVPPAVRTFVVLFDAGYYPDLVDSAAAFGRIPPRLEGEAGP